MNSSTAKSKAVTTHWRIRIEEPTGLTRDYGLQSLEWASRNLVLGRGAGADLPLNDLTLAPQAALLCARASSETEVLGAAGGPSPFWLRVLDGQPGARVGDLEIRETRLPEGVPVQLGESRIRLERSPSSETDPRRRVPVTPRGLQPWLTENSMGVDMLWSARKVARTPLSVYLAGETGTGKEVLAHLLHAWSERAAGPFVPLHCGALPISLAESELFGHVKGAFTGAHQQRSGALMQAHNGTLFLDEVGDLAPDLQVKLLRFLENGEIRPVGADRGTRINVRLVCATHHPLEKLVQEGRFRQDLFYRIASITLPLPALRHRPEDITLLSRTFAGELGRGLSDRALLRLQAHDWPGNVRELRHAIERACGMAGDFPLVGEEAFDFLLTPSNLMRNPELECPSARAGAAMLTLEEMERVMLKKALRLAHGHRGKAAAILGIARSTLFEMLNRYALR